MQKLIELYEMASLNDGALRETEKLAIRNARLALRMFERAMEGLTARISQTANVEKHATTNSAGWTAELQGFIRSQSLPADSVDVNQDSGLDG